MSAIPSKPLDIHKALTRIEKHYNTETTPPTDPLTLRAVKSIFSQIGSSPDALSRLSPNEKKTLVKLYEDISNMPCSQNPTLVQELQKYPKPLSRVFLPPGVKKFHSPKTDLKKPLDPLISDPLLETWKKAPQGSQEHEAYERITEYVTHIKELDLPPLDLSNLGLTELPAGLFTDPGFTDVNISGNKCAKFPQKLTIGSVRNIRLYEEMSNQINKTTSSSSKAVLDYSHLTAEISSYLPPKDISAAVKISRPFEEGTTLIIKQRLMGLKKIYPTISPSEIQTKLNNLNTLSTEELLELDDHFKDFFHKSIILKYAELSGEDNPADLMLAPTIRKITDSIPDDQKELFLNNEKHLMWAMFVTQTHIKPEESKEEIFKSIQTLANLTDEDETQIQTLMGRDHMNLTMDETMPDVILLLAKIPRNERESVCQGFSTYLGRNPSGNPFKPHMYEAYDYLESQRQ